MYIPEILLNRCGKSKTTTYGIQKTPGNETQLQHKANKTH